VKSLLDMAIIAAAVGCGVSGGVFFAFSTFVMPALGRLPAAQGIAAMQAINVDAINAPFMVVLFGSGVIGVGVAGVALAQKAQRASWFVAAALVYLCGTLLVTMACNVPLNEALAGLEPEGARSASSWSRYLAHWTLWNHVRAVGGALSTALLVVAILVRAKTTATPAPTSTAELVPVTSGSSR
jgi:uncharacterized membrane protein